MNKREARMEALALLIQVGWDAHYSSIAWVDFPDDEAEKIDREFEEVIWLLQRKLDRLEGVAREGQKGEK